MSKLRESLENRKDETLVAIVKECCALLSERQILGESESHQLNELFGLEKLFGKKKEKNGWSEVEAKRVADMENLQKAVSKLADGFNAERTEGLDQVVNTVRTLTRTLLDFTSRNKDSSPLAKKLQAQFMRDKDNLSYLANKLIPAMSVYLEDKAKGKENKERHQLIAKNLLIVRNSLLHQIADLK